MADIPGTGYAAFAVMFRRIGLYGLRNIVKMPEEDFQRLFVDIKYEESELVHVINELRFLRDPCLNIDEIHPEANLSFASYRAGQMFFPRFGNLNHSAYYDYICSAELDLRALFRAWLIDLSNGLLAIDKRTAAKFIRCRHIRGFEFAKDVAQFIIKNDLEKEFNKIPDAMIQLARLENVKIVLNQIKSGDL